MLEDLQLLGLLEQGKANLISIEAIRLALGRRWAERKTVVWQMMEAQIHRRLGAQDFSARLNEDEFLLITPELGAMAAHVMAVRILKDVLNHFLGETRCSDITIKVVADFYGGELTCQRLAPATIEAILATEEAAPVGSAPPPPPPAVEADAATTLDGRRLRFSSNVDPIIDLNRFAITGHRIEPKIQFDESRLSLSPAERRELLPRDVQAIDLATLRRGLARLSTGESAPGKPSLIMTVSFLSLSNSRARSALFAEANQARALMTQAVICEVTDFEEGLPVSRLEEAVALLKPFCRSVFVRWTRSGGTAKSAKALGVSGLVVQTPLAHAREDDFALWLLTMGKAVEGQAPTLIATNLPSSNLLPIAAASGFTHATVRA